MLYIKIFLTRITIQFNLNFFFFFSPEQINAQMVPKWCSCFFCPNYFRSCQLYLLKLLEWLLKCSIILLCPSASCNLLCGFSLLAGVCAALKHSLLVMFWQGSCPQIVLCMLKTIQKERLAVLTETMNSVLRLIAIIYFFSLSLLLAVRKESLRLFWAKIGDLHAFMTESQAVEAVAWQMPVP